MKPEQRADARVGTIVVRDGKIVYASEGAAALAGRGADEAIGRRFSDFVVEDERSILEDRHERRVRGEAVPQGYEANLLLPDGRRRAIEISIEDDGGEFLVHLRDASAQRARRLRLDSVATLGAAIQREYTEDGIYARVREELGKLGLSSALVACNPAGVRIVWASFPPEIGTDLLEVAERAFDGEAARRGEFFGRLSAQGAAFAEDFAVDASLAVSGDLSKSVREIMSATGMGRAAAARVEQRGDEQSYLVVVGDWLRPDDLPTVRLFGAQLGAALDAARTISDLSHRNADLAMLNRVADLAGEATDLEALFTRAAELLRGAIGCRGIAAFVLDEAAGQLVRVFQQGAPTGILARHERRSLEGLASEAIRLRAPLAQEVPTVGPGSEFAELGFRTLAWVPLIVRSKVIGLLGAGFDDPEDRVRERLDLLAAATAHFASAVESQTLLGRLRRRLSDLEAVHALAERVFENAPGDMPALLQDGCREAAKALSCRTAILYLAEDEGRTLRAAASWGAEPERFGTELCVKNAGLACEAMRLRAPAWSKDVTRDPRSAMHGRPGFPPLAVLAVPVTSRDATRGVLYLSDRDGRVFTEAEVALANALGGELAVGLENAELYADLRRRVEELSLLNEMARTVAGSLDLDAVLVEGVKAARRLLGASRGFVALYDPIRSELRFGAGAGYDETFPPSPVPLAEAAILGDVILERRPFAIEDAAEDSRIDEDYRRRFVPRSLLAAPLLLRGEPLGVLLVDEARERRRFTDADVERVTAIANHLAVAVDNARLYSEARRRAEQLGLLHEVGRSLVATLDIKHVLERGVQNLARIVDAPSASLALVSADGTYIEVCAVAGAHVSHLGLRLPLDPPDSSLATLVFRRREPIVVEDALSDPRVNAELRADTDSRGYLGIPLVVRDRTIGSAVIMDSRGPRRFTPAEVERAAAIANQLAVAVENARLYDDLRKSYADLERAQQRIIQGERLAALGELSAVVAHEVRNPLGVIFNSLGSLRRLLRPVGDAKMLLDIVGEEADRLNRIVGDLLDFAHPSMPQLRLEPFDRVVDEAVGAALAQNPSAIEIMREMDPSIPPVPMDARLVRQAVLNVVVNAVQAMPRGGRISVRTLRAPDAAVLEIEDSGPGIPDEVKARVFEPFFTTKASGTGLGLAVVKRIIEGHGGGVIVRGNPGGGTVFALRLPLASNRAVENAAVMG